MHPFALIDWREDKPNRPIPVPDLFGDPLPPFPAPNFLPPLWGEMSRSDRGGGTPREAGSPPAALS